VSSYSRIPVFGWRVNLRSREIEVVENPVSPEHQVSVREVRDEQPLKCPVAATLLNAPRISGSWYAFDNDADAKAAFHFDLFR
jgi:hypothetical protein